MQVLFLISAAVLLITTTNDKSTTKRQRERLLPSSGPHIYTNTPRERERARDFFLPQGPHIYTATNNDDDDDDMAAIRIPEVSLSSGSKPMPLIAFGTASLPLVPSESTRKAILHAIRLGYRHFDTAFVYGSEESLGEAVVEALESGLIQSRDELFITSKLWCRDAHGDRVLPALQKTLGKLQMEYLDLYLIHWPVSAKPAEPALPLPTEELLPMDMRSVWEAMEECQRLGLTRSIGVCNFSCKKMDALLSTARIPPAVNQVEVNPLWQQKKTREFCLEKGIQVCGYSPLGGRGTLWGQDWVMECDVLQQIARAKGKTLAQVCLRWVHEQGDCVIVKSFNEKRMKENLDILDWKLSEEEKDRISQIPQRRGCLGLGYVSAHGPYKSLEELWDGEKNFGPLFHRTGNR